MAHLKSFKYLEGDAESATAAAAGSQSSHDELDRGRAGASLTNTNQQEPNATRSSSVVSSASTTSSDASSRSRVTQGASTVGGGNLTTDTSSQSSATAREPLDQTEEFQSARVDLGEEEEEDDGENQENRATKNLQISDNGSSSSSSGSENVTKIEIEHPAPLTQVGVSRGQLARPLNQDILLNQVPLKTPLTPRLRLNMPRSQTSPSKLNQAASAATAANPLIKSPILLRGHGQVPPGGGRRAPSPIVGGGAGGDNTSQYSYAMQQQRSSQFEIRWHNVKLYSRPRSRLPRLVTDSFVYRSLFNSHQDSEADLAAAAAATATCYSPPVQHKIPPTIDEGLEMRTPPPEENEEAAAATAVAGQVGMPSADDSLNSNKVSKQQQQQQQPQAFGGATFAGRSLSSNKLEAQQQQQQLGGDAAPRLRCILNNVSGQVFSGQMTAILGPSGVGKTTLLNSLTGRNTLDGTGRVSLMGANESKRMSVVTVPQMDVLPGKLTTLEDLQFTSRLKNPQSRFDHARNIERIVKCLHMEKFLHTRIDKLSGGEARRLSIGRELLNSPDIMILDEPTSGLDANTCKKIITALRDIVEHSDNILDKPMSIIITIHQPQQEVYNIFHRVYVMAIGGRVIYEGSPQMLLPTLIEQSSLSRVQPTNQLNENPAIVAIEVASGEFGPQIIDELAAHHENQVYEEFVLYNANVPSPLTGGIGSLDSPLTTPRSVRGLQMVAAHKSPPLNAARFDLMHRKRLNSFDSSIGRPTPILAKRQFNGGGGPNQIDRMSSMTSLSYASTYDGDLPEPISKLKVDKRLRRSVVMKSNFLSHTLTLIKRCWLLTKRDMFLMAIRVIGFLLVAAGTVQIFSHALDPQEHQCPQFESEVDDMFSYIGQVRTRLLGLLDVLRQGNSTHLLFFHVLLCITMVTSALTGLVFPLQMRMFVREYKNGWYSPASFITSQTIAELPMDMIGPILVLLIVYPLCHQPDSVYYWREFGYAMVLATCSLICKSQAQIVGAFLMDSVENSVFIACVCVTGPALLSGIPLRIEQMIAPMQWVSYGSFLRYSFESLMALRYGYGMCPCDPELVNGYPVTASARAIPPHLENLAVGLLEINRPASDLVVNETTPNSLIDSSTQAVGLIGERENLFLRFLRLISDASNMFISGEEIGDCSNYRSLYLIGMNIPKNVLNNWIPAMLLMFIISRILTYFAVKTVIKLRRS